MTAGSARTCGGAAVGDLAAVVEHDDVVGDAHHDAHIVLDQQDADLLLVADREQQLAELGQFARVEPGGRLVEAQQARPGAQRAGDFEPALVAVGQRAGRQSARADQPEPVEPMSGRGRSPPARRAR